jgi:hypothetical protein
MMKEMIVLAITLVVAQTTAGLIMMKVFMSEWFIKKTTKRSFKLMKTIERDINDWMSEEEEA